MVRWASGILVAVLLVSTASVAVGSVAPPSPGPVDVSHDGGSAASADGLSPGNETRASTALPGLAADGGPYDALAQQFDRATNEFTVYENGTARWTTRFYRPLNESTRPDFEGYAEEFNTQELDLFRSFRIQANNLAALGTQITGREMNATRFSKRAYVDEDTFTLGSRGVVEMNYVWTNMARVDGDTVEVGDVFGGGFTLGSRFELTARPGPGLVFVRALPDPDSMAEPGSLRESRSITWEGQRDFPDQRPLIEFAPPETLTTAAPQTTVTTTTTTTAVETTAAPRTTAVGGGGPVTAVTTTASPADAGSGGDMTMLVVGVIVLLLGLGTAAVWRATTETDDGGGPTAAAAEAEPAPETTADSQAVEESAAAGSEAEAEPVAEEELLSDTDRVTQLLEANDGRMRQSEIVEETDWSKSKVSMLLSDMEDEEEITKLRVGRENLISLPGHEPDAAGSPFEDEE